MFIKVFRKLINLFAEPLRRRRAKRLLVQLLESKNTKIIQIGEALRETLLGIIPPEEKAYIDLIERRRALLLKSTEMIDVLDYGAGRPHSERSNAEMHDGVKVKSSVTKVTRASKPYFWALFLFKMIRKLNPSNCLEMGSCVGISTAYLGAAMHINKCGKMISLEGSPEIAKLAKATLDLVGLKNSEIIVGPFHETLNDALEQNRPVDFLFNDGHHDGNAVINYFNQSIPYLREGCVIVFDDV
jgi:predicted O-methyltransferase YrrM